VIRTEDAGNYVIGDHRLIALESFVKLVDTMKFNCIAKFIHYLGVFISIKLLINVAWGAWFGVLLTSLSIIEVRVVYQLGLV
jgi:hypothetical protein